MRIWHPPLNVLEVICSDYREMSYVYFRASFGEGNNSLWIKYSISFLWGLCEHSDIVEYQLVEWMILSIGHYALCLVRQYGQSDGSALANIWRCDCSQCIVDGVQELRTTVMTCNYDPIELFVLTRWMVRVVYSLILNTSKPPFIKAASKYKVSNGKHCSKTFSGQYLILDANRIPPEIGVSWKCVIWNPHCRTF